MAEFCTNCGAQMDEGNKVCGYCGTPVAGGAARQTEKVLDLKKEAAKKSAKKPFLAIIVASVAVAAVFAAYQIFFKPDYLSALERYCKAIEAGGKENVLSVYEESLIKSIADACDESVDAIEESLGESAARVYESMSSQCGDKMKVSYETVGITEEGKNAYMIVVQYQAKGKDGDYYGKMQEVHTYKSGKKWYLVPDWDAY